MSKDENWNDILANLNGNSGNQPDFGTQNVDEGAPVFGTQSVEKGFQSDIEYFQETITKEKKD